MGNQQTTLSGIHPFKDPDDPAGLPAPPLIQFPSIPSPTEEASQSDSHHHHPQQVTIGPASPRWIEATQGNKFDDLFVLKAPTPPPRRPSEPLRGTLRAKQAIKSGFSLRNLHKMISRPDLNKIGTLLRWKKKRRPETVYPVPPDAQKPSPPSKPEVFLEQDEFFMVRWDPPAYDGGLPIIGYIIQHLELGLPQVDLDEVRDETQCWYSSEPGQVTSTEVLLNNLIEGTTYQFRIIAENLLGYSQPGEMSDPIVFNPRGILNDYFCAPVLIIPLDETYNAIEHERITLSLEITGQPYPIVRWYDKNEVEIGGVGCDPRFVVASAGQKRLLTIAGVECSDSGGIRAVGENEKGTVECKTTLIVEAPPHIRRVQRLNLLKSEDPLELPKDEQKLLKRRDSRNDEEVIFQSGEFAKFKFMWSASPYPNICVYHEGELVDGEETGADRGRVRHERVTTEVTQNLISVQINGVKRTDRGEWLVRLDNALGEDSAHVIVTVTDRPSRTGKPDVLQLSDNTVILKWEKPQDDGGCPVQGYIVEYYRSEWGVWLKACTTKNPYTKIRDLIPGSKYKFRVKAENLYGVSEPSEESVELLITDLASTLRSVTGDGDAAGLLMTTVEEEEEEAIPIEEEEPGTGDQNRPTPPRRKFDRGSTASIMRVSTSTMTDLSGVVKGKSMTPTSNIGASDSAIYQRSKSPVHLDLDLNVPKISRSPSPSNKFLSVSFQPQVILLPDDEDDEFGEDVLRPPEIVERKSPDFPRRLPEISKKSPEIHISSKAQNYSPLPMNITVERSPSPRPIVRTTIQSLDFTTLNDDPSTQMEKLARADVEETGPVPIPPRRHLHPQKAPPPQLSLSPTTFSTQFQTTIQPPDSPRKLYSRSEIIKSAAANEIDYYYGLSESSGAEPAPLHAPHDEEEPEEDPELRKVKEALKNDTLFDDLEDEEDEEFEYDFDKLREEYEEDKKRGMVSRQDSGVSGKSGGTGRSESLDVEEEPSYTEDLPETEASIRASSIQSERLVGSRRIEEDPTRHREPFERAQSEVAGVGRRMDSADFMGDSRRGRDPYRPSAQQGVRSSSGSRTFLTDRFTDYIAMKASSRNKAVGSSLRSLSSRYSSTENVVGGAKGGTTSRDSGRSSMVVPEGAVEGASSSGGGVGAIGGGGTEEREPEGEENSNTVFNKITLIDPKPFTFREFNAEEEAKIVKGLEGSKASSGSKRSFSTLPYDLIHPVQSGSREVVEGGFNIEEEGSAVPGNSSVKEVDEKEEQEQRKRSLPPVSIVPNRFISNPDIFLMMSGTGGESSWERREGLEHSKSETNFDTWIPDSVLKMRAGSFIMKGGVGGEDTTEEDYSYGGEDMDGIGSAEEAYKSGSHSDKHGRGKLAVSFGDTDEEFSFEDGSERDKQFPGDFSEVKERLTGMEEEDEEEFGEELEHDYEAGYSRLGEIMEEGASDDDGYLPEEENSDEHILQEGERINRQVRGESFPRRDEDSTFYYDDEEELELQQEQERTEAEVCTYEEKVERPDEIPNPENKENEMAQEIITASEIMTERFEKQEKHQIEEDSRFYYEDEEEMQLQIQEDRLQAEICKKRDQEEPEMQQEDEKKTDMIEQTIEDTPQRQMKEKVERNIVREEEDDGAFYYDDEVDLDLKLEQQMRKETEIFQGKDQCEESEPTKLETISIQEPCNDYDETFETKPQHEAEDVEESSTFYYEDEMDKEFEMERQSRNIKAETEEVPSSILQLQKFDIVEEDSEGGLVQSFGFPEKQIQVEFKVGENTVDIETIDKPTEIISQTEEIPSPSQQSLQQLVLDKDEEALRNEERDNEISKLRESLPVKICMDVDSLHSQQQTEQASSGKEETTEEYKQGDVIPKDNFEETSNIENRSEINQSQMPSGESKLREPDTSIENIKDMKVPENKIQIGHDKVDLGPGELNISEKVTEHQSEHQDSQNILPQAENKTFNVPFKLCDNNSKPQTISTSVEIQDSYVVEDVVVENLEVEVNLEKIQKKNEKQKSSQSNFSEQLKQDVIEENIDSQLPLQATSTTASFDEEMDSELLNYQMSLIPKSQQQPLPHSHHHQRSSSYSESRRSLSIDRLFLLTPVQEESAMEGKPTSPPPPPPPPLSTSPPSYRPTMSIYYERVSMPKSPSLSSSRNSIYSSQSITTPTRPTSPDPRDEDHISLDISEIRNQIFQSTAKEFIDSVASQLRPETPPSGGDSSRPSTPIISRSLKLAEENDREISPFMNYLFNGAFYLMLSPMLYFVDSLYLALLCLVVVACVHFFIIKF